jgi:hypothetical protein
MEIFDKERSGAREQGSLRPYAAFHPLDDDPPAIEVYIVPLKEPYLTHPEAVMVDE